MRPEDYRPQLAQLAAHPPHGSKWVHELKLDGYRAGLFIDGKTIRLISRRGSDFGAEFPEIIVPFQRGPSWDEAFGLSRDVAQRIVDAEPETYTMNFDRAKRARRILLDYKRNYRTSIAVAGYSTRAPGSDGVGADNVVRIADHQARNLHALCTAPPVIPHSQALCAAPPVIPHPRRCCAAMSGSSPTPYWLCITSGASRRGWEDPDCCSHSSHPAG